MEDVSKEKHYECLADTDHDRKMPEIDFLSPLTLRGVTFRNRIGMSPMCQYSAKNGLANDWHLVHLGSRAAGGASLVMTEFTAVVPEGRITPSDLGLWSDEHIKPLQKIVQFVESQGAIPGIQLAHSGRKGSCSEPWKGGGCLRSVQEGGWTVVAPSAIPFDRNYKEPDVLTEEGIGHVVQAFEKATKRALAAGFKVIEIHAAHGYLLHQFLSPISNQRTDSYGGSIENRMKVLLRVVSSVRKIVPQTLPLFVRISATDWIENGWDIEQSIQLVRGLKHCGVDLVDVSSGGVSPHAQIPISRGYQVPLAKRIREEVEIKTSAVGLITETAQANEIITGGSADFLFLGRELLKDPYWVLKAEHEFGNDPTWPLQYGYAIKRKGK